MNSLNCCLNACVVSGNDLHSCQSGPVKRACSENKCSLSNRKRKVHCRVGYTSCNFRPYKYFTGNECGEPRKWHRYDLPACSLAHGSLHQPLFTQCRSVMSPLQSLRWSPCLPSQLSLSGHSSQTTEKHDFWNITYLIMQQHWGWFVGGLRGFSVSVTDLVLVRIDPLNYVNTCDWGTEIGHATCIERAFVGTQVCSRLFLAHLCYFSQNHGE